MENNQRRIGIILSYLLLVLNAVINFIYVPILLHYMGQGEYGLYQLMGSLLATLVILDFGLPATVIRYYSKYKSLKDKVGMENILAMCSRIYIVLTILLILVGSGIYFFLDGMFSNSLTPQELVSAKAIYIILLINILIALPTQIFNAIITAYERFIFLKASAIVQILLQPIVVILLMSVSPYAITLTIIYTIFNLLLALARIYYCFTKIKVKIKMHYFDKTLFKSIIGYSFFIFLNVIVDQIFWRLNQIILGVVATTAAVAVYSIASQISINYMSLSTAVSSVFLPKITDMVTHKAPKKELSDLFIKAGRLQFLLLSCVLGGFILFGRQFISIWAGTGFDDTYLITLILIIPFTVDLIQSIGQVILQAEDKFYFRALVFLGVAILNIIIVIPVAQKYGGIGCSIVTGLTFFIGNAFIMNIYYAKIIAIDIKQFWVQMIKIFVPISFCTVLGSFLNFINIPVPIVDFGVKIIIYLVMYFITIRCFAMNEYEKNLIKIPIDKIKRYFIKV